MDLAEKGERVL